VSLALAVQNLGAACVQGLLLAAAALVLARLMPLERPRVMLWWWQAVLLACLALPWVQPWSPGLTGRVEVALLRIGPALAEPGTAFGRWAWADVLAAVVAAGILLRAAWLAAGLLRLGAFRRRAIPLEPRRTALAGLENALGTRAAFLVSDEVGSPATFGLRRPVVLLPRAFLEMDAEGQRAVATHELLHVRRRDWLMTLFEEGLASLFWFHPAVHLVLGRIRLAREQRVDELVVVVLGGRQAYLESLLEMARHDLRRRMVPAALLLREHHLRDRVELLLKEVTMSRARVLSHLAASAAFLTLAGAMVASSFPLQGQEGGAKAAVKNDKSAKAVGEPRIIHKVAPEYPAEAKKDKLEGIVLIDVRVGKDGKVADARVKSGHPTLAEAALAAVRQWRYEPILGPDRKPVEVALTITINFRLS
jgi:TonB family protein